MTISHLRLTFPDIFFSGLPPEPSPGVRDPERAPPPVPDGAVAALPHLRGVHLPAGDGQGDAGDLLAPDQGAATEGE